MCTKKDPGQKIAQHTTQDSTSLCRSSLDMEENVQPHNIRNVLLKCSTKKKLLHVSPSTFRENLSSSAQHLSAAVCLWAKMFFGV